MNNTVRSRCFSVARTAPATGRVFNLPRRQVDPRTPLCIVAPARHNLAMTWVVDRASGRPVCNWVIEEDRSSPSNARPVRQGLREPFAFVRLLTRLAA